MTSLRTMLTCRWAARRIQRYLAADPAVALDPAELTRLQAHLAECARCTGKVEEYEALQLALHAWAAPYQPDPALSARVHDAAERIIQEPAQ